VKSHRSAKNAFDQPHRPHLTLLPRVANIRLSPLQTCGVCSGLDELLRNLRVLPSNPVNRYLAPSQDTDVSLETVALYTYQSDQSSQVGNIEKAGHNDGIKS
jgi:hypothetical protein